LKLHQNNIIILYLNNDPTTLAGSAEAEQGKCKAIMQDACILPFLLVEAELNLTAYRTSRQCQSE